MIKADGYVDLTTHVFIDGDPYLNSDTVFAVKKSLIRTMTNAIDKISGEQFTELVFDIVMQKKFG